jgi:hypothetical protein
MAPRCGQPITTSTGVRYVITRPVAHVETDWRAIQQGHPPFTHHGPHTIHKLSDCTRTQGHRGTCGSIREPS